LFSPEEEGNWNLEGFMGKFRVWGEEGWEETDNI
jgi:hypothetical protein